MDGGTGEGDGDGDGESEKAQCLESRCRCKHQLRVSIGPEHIPLCALGLGQMGYVSIWPTAKTQAEPKAEACATVARLTSVGFHVDTH